MIGDIYVGLIFRLWSSEVFFLFQVWSMAECWVTSHFYYAVWLIREAWVVDVSMSLDWSLMLLISCMILCFWLCPCFIDIGVGEYEVGAVNNWFRFVWSMWLFLFLKDLLLITGFVVSFCDGSSDAKSVIGVFKSCRLDWFFFCCGLESWALMFGFRLFSCCL